MKILFVVPYVPNPIRVRPYELLRTLVTRGHQITLATLWQSEQERAEIRALEALGIHVVAEPLPKSRSLWNSALTLPTRTPLQATYCRQPRLERALYRLVAEQTFDVAHVEHLRGAHYGLLLRDLSAPSRPLPVIWDSVDCISHLFAQAARQSRSLRGRVMTALELERTRRYEGWLLYQFAQVLVTSNADQRALVELAERQTNKRAQGHRGRQREPAAMPTRPTVLPNGVDLSFFNYSDRSQTPSALPQAEMPATIVFSGKMSYHANITAALYLAREIMPLVWAQHPEVRLQIVGKDPSSQIRALATVTTGTSQRGVRQIEVTGTVPEMRSYLQQATVAVAPLLYGAGIQNKILEAMACGTPVVTTSQAAAGTAAQVGRDFLVADSAPQFAAALDTLLNDPVRRLALGQAGRAYVEAFHSWHAIAAQLETIYSTPVEQLTVPAKYRSAAAGLIAPVSNISSDIRIG
ncbi:MAG: glycosyltransferase [Caldilineaceae bacterium]